MRALLLFAILLLSTAAHAQYRCTVGGQKVYSDQPCARDAQHVGRLEDKVSAERAASARQQADARQREISSAEKARAAAEERRARIEAVRRESAPPPVDRCAEARKELARLREPLVIQSLAPRHPDPSGRIKNERLEEIGQAESRVHSACRGR